MTEFFRKGAAWSQTFVQVTALFVLLSSAYVVAALLGVIAEVCVRLISFFSAPWSKCF